MKISTVNQMRHLDRTAITQYGIAEELLMENAGLAAYQIIENAMLGVCGKQILIVCGIGNNGGDGLVVARKIHSNGGVPRIVLLGDPAKFKQAARVNYDIILKLPIEMIRIDKLTTLEPYLDRCDAVVDGIFGTGLDRNVGGLFADVIGRINQCHKPVFSLDIPSGVHGDNGKIMGIAVKADFTITFGLPKVGNLLYPGYGQGGQLHVTHISFPPLMYENDLKYEINPVAQIPPRIAWGHKGTFGDALFVAGAANYFGAPYLAAMSFLKSGGGYSRLAAPKSIIGHVAGKASEVVYLPMEETDTGSIAYRNKNKILEMSQNIDIVIMGPGISLNPETSKLVRELSTEIDKPVIIDGDGITAIAKDVSVLKKRKSPTILTPHMGEMARITQKTIPEIDADKLEILKQTATELNAIIVLKGAPTLIGFPDGKIFFNLSGNSGMGTAGSGDVLTGSLAAMFGLGLEIQDAVKAGVFIHGLSGDLAADNLGQDGMTAQDILTYLPHAVDSIRRQQARLIEHYAGAHVVL